ncbi:MAG: diguanylate cyclase [bacterium]
MSNNTRSKSILVVDDVPVNIQLLTTYLSSEGYQVISARDGSEAIAKVNESRPDLILLDVMMPKMNGFEVCKILKSEPRTKYIPVILVTALNEMQDKVKGMNSGADDFLSKPFNKLELLVRVRSLLRIKYLHDELQDKVLELQKTKEELRQLAITDGLTGLYNYRYFREQLQQEINRALRHELNLSLIMIDIDHFKHYNDTNGHPAGDLLLREMGKLLKDNIRSIDVASRYGGEEFCLVLNETNKNAARIVAEKIRKLVEEHTFEFEEKQPTGRITISTGVATFPEDGKEFEVLVTRADERLYLAKQAGRNTIFADS